MKKNKITLLLAVISLCAFALFGCGSESAKQIDLTAKTLDGEQITAESQTVNNGESVIYYEAGHGEEYGESTDTAEQHTADEAEQVEVLTITEPGTYEITGELTNGQLAVDLGENAKDDPNAVVTLILNNCNIQNSLAPAIIFYNVYECGSDEVTDTQEALAMDTATAGANIIIADDSVNNITGSHVARILETEEHPKYRFDGAFYSKMSMNITGDNGVLNIIADNEGLDTEMHLTVNGGNINIQSQDDGINTNEDGISTTIINGGNLRIAAGLGDEGDGIDSNGYLIINGGTVIAQANSAAGDSGLDTDCGTLINGGTVIATGSAMEGASEESAQGTMNLQMGVNMPSDSLLVITDEENNPVFAYDLSQDTVLGDNTQKFAAAIVSCPSLASGNTYHVYTGGTIEGTNTFGLYTEITSYQGGNQMSHGGTAQTNGMEFSADGRPAEQPKTAPEIPNGPQSGENGEPPALPQGDTGAANSTNGEPPALPEGETGAANNPNGEPPALPEGETGNQSQPPKPEQSGATDSSNEVSAEFVLIDNATTFSNVVVMEGNSTANAEVNLLSRFFGLFS